MIRIGYAPDAFDLFHIGHLAILRRARAHCDFLIAGVVSDDVLAEHKGVSPVIPLAERLEIVGNVRCVDRAVPAYTNDKMKIWEELHFSILFKGDDWLGTPKGLVLERALNPLGVHVVYLPYGQASPSTVLRQTLKNIDDLAEHFLIRELSLLPRPMH